MAPSLPLSALGRGRLVSRVSNSAQRAGFAVNFHSFLPRIVTDGSNRAQPRAANTPIGAFWGVKRGSARIPRINRCPLPLFPAKKRASPGTGRKPWHGRLLTAHDWWSLQRLSQRGYRSDSSIFTTIQHPSLAPAWRGRGTAADQRPAVPEWVDRP